MAAKRKSKNSAPGKAKSRGAADTGLSGIPRPWSEFLGIALLAAGAMMLGGLISYQSGEGTLMGPVGHLAAAASYAAFGMAAYLITLGVIGMGIKALLGQGMEITMGEAIGFTVATLAGCVLLHVMFPEYRVHGYTAGGLAGELVGEVSLGLFHHAGTYLVALALMIVGLLASTPLSTEHLLRASRVTGQLGLRVGRYLWGGIVTLIQTQRDPGPAERARSDESIDEDDEDWELEEEDPYAALEEAAFEEDEDEELEEDEEEESTSRPRKKLAGSKAKPKAKAKGKAKAKNTRRKKTAPEPEDEADELEDEDEEVEEDEAPEEIEANLEVPDKRQSSRAKRAGGSIDGSKGKASKKKAAEEEPEIIVKLDDEPPKSATSASGKKAPPRPEELANQNAAAKPAAPAKSAEKKDKGAMPGVIRLTSGPYATPPLELFEAAERTVNEFDRNFVLEQAQRLVTALGEFRIRGKVTKIHPGPVITRYEFKPEAGVKLSKIESLESDIAMALEAIRIRILAPIPGKATVGFEVPNKTRETVYIKEILEQDNFGQKQKLPLALGKDITGAITVTDLTKAPHLLVAGATGSGKSVGVNSMICSLLYTMSPEDVRMVMIDPKMLELSIYEGIPHLLLPVVTDPEKAALALRWAVQEMERRYALLSAAQVRDIAGYNRKLGDLVKEWEADVKMIQGEAERSRADAAEQGEDGADGTTLPGMSVDPQGNPVEVVGGLELPDKPEKLPYIVVIIDEFADLMMVASKEVEQCVARIAAKARAAGIHLIVATQRPSVDVITGTIKNNFPSRIAFQVTSDADSRTILDSKGAKQLLGMGDMLHMDRGLQPQRVHGCFVSEDEILEVVKFVKKQAKPVYNMDIVRKRDDGGDAGDADENLDPLYDRAVEIVAEAQKVSTSMLQRRLGIGYNRSAKIVECMEERGVIGPARGTTPREVFVSAA
jgi:S-DNA-T family DNA segregation ATPase FtsK/SpoIIIE